MTAPARLEVHVERRFAGGPAVAARFEVPLDGGTVTVLFGPSGAGKTTVLRAIAGLERPDGGRVVHGGETWFDAARARSVPPERRRVGLVSQADALFPHLSVAGNLAFGLFALPAPERRRRVDEAARLVGVHDLLARRPVELSSGQRQRVALGRALAPGPRLLLLDEPLSALDAPSREELRRELRRVLSRSATPALLVTHDRDEALELGDRMVVLVDGTVRQEGAVTAVFNRPADAAVARAVGTENVLAARVRGADAGLVTVAVGEASLVAVHEAPVAGDVLACFRADDVVLESPGGQPTSARNRLAAAVVAVERRGPLVRVALDAGFPLQALVTARSADELQLQPGSRVVALVKAQAVRLLQHAGA